jgi:predicted RNA binding protein YcfA (HicA-like mRNA interferase family)
MVAACLRRDEPLLISVYEVCILDVGRKRGMNSREIIKLLARDGWHEVAQSGSHKQFKHPDKPGRVTVPHPKKEVPIGTLKSIEKQAGLKLR